MDKKDLKNKPLVEVLFEMKWKLQEAKSGMKIDPHYKLLIGRLYDAIGEAYPHHEPLPASSVPDEMVPGIVQHRFRIDKDKWPLVQIGPGILTVNETESYVWEDFEERVMRAVNEFMKVYPNSKELEMDQLMLRYIDAIEFNYEKDNIFEFLKDQLKINISLHSPLFTDTCVENLPSSFDWRFSFRCTKPNATVTIRFFRGQKPDGTTGLVWETIVISNVVNKDEMPKKPDEMMRWLKEAHHLTHDWFFKLIDGELLRRFEQ